MNISETVRDVFTASPDILSAGQRATLAEEATGMPEAHLQALIASAMIDQFGAVVAVARNGLLVSPDGTNPTAPTSEIDLTSFGVAADGVTDDAIGLQAAINAAQDNGRPLYIPAGNYLFSSGLVVPDGHPGITGSGLFKTQLYFTGTGTGLTIGGAGAFGIYSDFQVFSGAPGDNLAARRAVERNGIYWHCYGGQGSVKSVKAFGFNGFGQKYEAIWDSVVDNVITESCGNTTEWAFSIINGTDTSNHTNFNRIQCEVSIGKAFYATGLQVVITGLHCERTTGDGTNPTVQIEGDVAVDTARVQALSNGKNQIGIASGFMRNVNFQSGPTTFVWGARLNNTALIEGCNFVEAVTISGSNLRHYEFAGCELAASLTSAYAEKTTTLRNCRVAGNILLTGVGSTVTLLGSALAGTVAGSSTGQTIEHFDCAFTTAPTVGTAAIIDLSGPGRQATVTVAPDGSANYQCTFAHDEVQINAAITAVNAAGGGTVFVKAGNYKIQASIVMKSNVILRGAGRGTVLFGYGTGFPIITGLGTTSALLIHASVMDLSIDGTNVIDSSWTPNSKGIYMTNLRRCKFVNLYVYNTSATGIGTDFLIDSVITGCVIESAGRQFSALGGSVGGNGIGIGTGNFNTENLAISDCQSVSCGNNGIMLEQQANPGGQLGQGVTISNCTSVGNKTGFRFSSVSRVSLTGCQSINSAGFGVQIAASYVASPISNSKIIISGCHIYDGTSDGINIDSTGMTSNNQLTIIGNQIDDNGGCGIKIAFAISDAMIIGNKIKSNSKEGIKVLASAGQVSHVTISNNRVSNNGTSSAGTYSAISLAQSGTGTIDEVRLNSNMCWDSQATKTQAYGIEILGTHTNTSLLNNDVRGSLTGTLNISASTTCALRLNPGYNPVGPSVVTVTASPMTYTSGQSPERLYVMGGTVSGITKAGVTVATATPAAVALEPGQAVIITYTVAPTMAKDVQ